MKLTKFFMTMLILTMLSIAYIHLQVQICDLGYRGQRKELRLQELREYNDNVRYNICMLKSANNIGVRFFENDTNLQFLGKDRIVKLKTNNAVKDTYGVSSRRKPKKQNFLARIFSLKSQAEAGSIK